MPGEPSPAATTPPNGPHAPSVKTATASSSAKDAANSSICLAASLSTAVAVLTAGCANGTSSNETSSTAASSQAPTSASPGGVSVDVSGANLTITNAIAHLNRSGDGTLTMIVRNDDGVPEHLGMVATPGGGRGTLVGGKSAEGNGSLSTAGILLLTGTTVTFGGSGPRVLLPHVHGISAQHTLPVPSSSVLPDWSTCRHASLLPERVRGIRSVHEGRCKRLAAPRNDRCSR